MPQAAKFSEGFYESFDARLDQHVAELRGELKSGLILLPVPPP